MKKFLYNNRDIILVSLIFAALLIIVFWDIFFSDGVFIKRDVSRYYYPMRKFAVESMKRGEIPLWNPYLFCGAPLHAAIQHSVFYPLTLIYYFIDVARGLGIFTIFHILLAGIFMYIFTIYIGVSKTGSFLAGFSFMFSGYIMSTICLTIGLSSTTWFPLTMLIFVKGLKEKKYILSIYLGIVLTLMFLAGDPAVTVATFGVIFLVSGYIFVEKIIKEKKNDKFLLYYLFIVLILFFLLTAFQTFPALEYFSRTSRQAMSWQDASVWSMPYMHLFSLVMPYFNDASIMSNDVWNWSSQIWLDNYYIGIVILILASFALWFGIRRRLVKSLLAIGLIFLAISLGRNFILYPVLFKLVPVIRLIRYPVRFFFVFTFAACALGGIGYDYLRGALLEEKLRRISKVFLLIAFLLSSLAIGITLLYAKIEPLVTENITKIYGENPAFKTELLPFFVFSGAFNLRRTILYIACFGLFLFLGSRTKYKKFISLVILFLACMDIILTNTGFEPIEKRLYFKRPTKNVKYLLKDKSLYRIFPSPYAAENFTLIRGKTYQAAMDACKDLLITNRMMEFGIYDVWGYDSTRLNRNHDIVEKIYMSKKPDATRLLNLLNVKYIVSHDKMKAEGFMKVNETENASLYMNSGYLPRAFLTRKSVVLSDDKDILEYMASQKFNPEKEIILEKNVGLEDTKSPEIKEDKVEVIKYKPRLVEIGVTCKKPAFLLLSDTYYPGWYAYIDGDETEIYRADYFLRAVKVPEGGHAVKFIYDPISFKIGSAISIVTTLLLLGTFFKKLTKR